MSFLSQITHQSLSKISKCHARCREIYRQAVTLYKSETRHVTGLIELCTDRRAVLLCSAWPGLRWARVGDGATGPPAFPVLTLTGLVCLYVGTKQFSLRFPLCPGEMTPDRCSIVPSRSQWSGTICHLLGEIRYSEKREREREWWDPICGV